MQKVRDFFQSGWGIVLVLGLLLPGTSLLIAVFDLPNWVHLAKFAVIFAVVLVGTVWFLWKSWRETEKDVGEWLFDLGVWVFAGIGVIRSVTWLDKTFGDQWWLVFLPALFALLYFGSRRTREGE